MKIIWSKQADQDIDQIFNYLLPLNSAASVDIIANIQSSVSFLSTFPNLGKLGRAADTRELAVTGSDYTIIYHVFDECVEILSVLHQSNQWPTAFG